MILIKTIEEILKYVPMDVNLHYEKILPFINDAQRKFIKPLLGDDYYTAFVTDYTTNTNPAGVDSGMDADNLELLPYVQRALANYMAYLSVPHLGTAIGSAGLQEQFTANSRPAPAYKVRSLQQQYINQADLFADELLEYLEENATALKYPTWFADIEANTAMAGTIVYSTKIASKYIDINESRRVFLRLKKRILEIEKNDVKKMVCSDQYTDFVTQIKTGTLTSANRALLELIEPYIAKKALYLTIPSIRISVTNEGITIHSTNDGAVQKTAAAREEVKDLMKTLKDSELNGFDADWEKINQFIIENIADYPSIEASPCWTSKNLEDPKYKVDNDPCNKHFSV